jgi:type I restriction enzyme S subunit
LGNVPKHWEVGPLRRRLIAIKDGTHGTFERVSDGVPLLSAKNVGEGSILIDERESLISIEDWSEITSNGFPRKGDVLLTIVGSVGRSAVFVAEQPIAFQRSVAFLRFRAKQSPYLMSYFFQSPFFQAQLRSRIKAAAQGGTYMGDLVDIPVVMPPSNEQCAIADFLDRQTEKIDSLIAKKRALIEKLKEKRSALISRTVTRGLPPKAARAAGLDPHPPLKTSGVDWIGEIPKHWTVLPYKRVCNRVDVGIAEAATHAYCDDGVPIVRSTNVRPNALDTKDILRIERWFAEKNKSKTLHAGDLVTVRTGYPGTTAVIPPEYEGSQCFTLVLSTPKPQECSRFFSYFLNAAPGSTWFEMEGWGTAQTNISVPIVQYAPVTRPPSNEQRAIVDFLECETTKIDHMVGVVEAAVERLHEYRSALITAAVTGKIDLRGTHDN